MNELDRIVQLNEKMQRLLEAVSKNGGRFSSIDKDLLSGYVRELYELTMSVRPASSFSSAPTAETTHHQETVVKKEEIPPPPHEEEHKQNGVKRTLTEIFADKNENGKTSVNERFRKQSPEIADKLKHTPIKDLKAYIGLNKRFAFIEALFNDREQDYDVSLERVNNARNYEEAMNYIKSEVLPRYQWSDEDVHVSEFLTLVLRRYLK